MGKTAQPSKTSCTRAAKVLGSGKGSCTIGVLQEAWPVFARTSIEFDIVTGPEGGCVTTPPLFHYEYSLQKERDIVIISILKQKFQHILDLVSPN